MTGDLRQRVLDWLDDREGEMIDFLARLVNIDSGSYDKAGVDAVGEEIRTFLRAAGIAHDVAPRERFGDVIRAEVPGTANHARPILIMGHRDTVFPQGEAERRPFRIENGRAYGPGVADMKAGLVMNSFVLAAFARCGGADAPLVGLYTGDEEIASPSSREAIESEARNAAIVLNSEPGRPSGNVVTGRRGCIFIRFEVTGRSAHSGVNFHDGISAIEELARKTQALHALTDPSKDITVNVGRVHGGQSVNTVAPLATAEVDLRYSDPAVRAPLIADVERILGTSSLEGTSCTFGLFGEFPPMHQTPAGRELFELYRASAASIGLDVGGEFTNGAADSGFSAAVGTPTLCGLGPVGGRFHSDDEYMEVATLLPRAKALAQTILNAPR